ncbi:Hypothetical predicted protein [Cloeon dipterum]|uniref:Uncharacterized protein n=1 Tax=Cloeon dipterum TaxID=197152 RepID=A0A8S1CS27_9INSE|nr:Hypothetical predicted protein [Cloeon dipterum]
MDDKKLDTSIGKRMTVSLSQIASLCHEISLPLSGTIPERFVAVKKNYPSKKWSADSAHLKYRLDKDGNAINTASPEVFHRMFKFNQEYLQAILDEEVECELYKMFKRTEPPHEMPKVAGSFMFGFKNTDMLANLIMNEMNLQHEFLSGKCHLCISVLLPELVVKMVGDIFNCERLEATKKMRHYSQRFSEDLCSKIL